MRETFVCADGSSLHVAEHGDAGAPLTVVLVHCYALDHQDWDPVLPGLAAASGTPLRIITYDQRGYGASDPATAADATLDRLGDDLAELITAVVPSGPVVLVGHSMGGMTVMALAERHPDLVRDRVAGVVLLSTAAGDMPRALSLGLPGPLAALVHRAERVGVSVLSALRREVLTRHPRVLEPFVRWLVFGVEARAADVAAVARVVASCRPATMLAFRLTFDEHDRREALAAFQDGPATVMVGDRDRVTPPCNAAVIAEWLPGSRLTILPGAGHMLPYERPAEVTAAIADVVSAALGTMAELPATG
ncbi:MAG TPA: alpha/beta hydrolase [Pseudonocardiaceae bacterium]